MEVARFYRNKAETESDEPKLHISHINERSSQIQYSILKPSSKVKMFYKQDEAIAYRGLDESLLLFSFENRIGGGRNFLVASADVFWENYIDFESKHHYEVIAENVPCKLYLDLEFKIEDNPGRDGNSMVDGLISSLQKFILKIFQLSIIKEDTLILDSTSPSKFSNHLIFPTLVFVNNYQAGQFIRDFINSLDEQELKIFKVLKGDETELFIDTGVYTKNRNFRLFLSSKYGKNQTLTVSDNDLLTVRLLEEKFGDENFNMDKEVFSTSLVTLLPEGQLIYPYGCSSSAAPKYRRNPLTVRKSANDRTEKKSPYEEIDEFVKKIIEPGFIRKWSIHEDVSMLVYEIGGTRFCGNVGREHKSNNIRYMCNLKEGVLYQKCHDPQCREYRGPDIVIPEELFPWNNFGNWEDDDEEEKSPLGPTHFPHTNSASKRKSEDGDMNSRKCLNEGSDRTSAKEPSQPVQGFSQEVGLIWNITGQSQSSVEEPTQPAPDQYGSDAKYQVQTQPESLVNEEHFDADSEFFNEWIPE